MLPAEIIARFRIDKSSGFKLADCDPGDTCGLDIDKKEAKELLETGVKRLAQLQERLYAEGHWAVLAILQGIDTSGKDGVIKHVLSGVNPQGCEVHSFKAPSAEELQHDFLWRVAQRLPASGRIGIFNRSHYEDIIEVRVHKIIPRSVWYQRYRQINEFEQYLSENNIKIIKLFLHISKDEQNKRLEDRLKDPKKRWKIDEKDIQKRKYWDEYLKAHEDIINKCNASWAPWYIIPSNIKWFRNILAATILVHILESMNLSFPKPKVDISKMTIE